MLDDYIEQLAVQDEVAAPVGADVDRVETQSDAELIEHRKIPPLGAYTLVRIRRR
jgi:hypothetical protein